MHEKLVQVMRLLKQNGFELTFHLSTYGLLTLGVKITIFLLALRLVERDLRGVTRLRCSNWYHLSASVSHGFWRDAFEERQIIGLSILQLDCNLQFEQWSVGECSLFSELLESSWHPSACITQ
ncbi:hypothetical protein C8R21_11279 [Nitrosospira multiformis]|uniref:Uncharacterized protein n=1 Tax=Nitrosospira multiformis TaxID=1231 RepID=A0A2T5IB45_9PROT|nr:hypothetical protein C8R21_11279 [Nitrosospira multiformis]